MHGQCSAYAPAPASQTFLHPSQSANMDLRDTSFHKKLLSDRRYYRQIEIPAPYKSPKQTWRRVLFFYQFRDDILCFLPVLQCCSALPIENRICAVVGRIFVTSGPFSRQTGIPVPAPDLFSPPDPISRFYVCSWPPHTFPSLVGGSLALLGYYALIICPHAPHHPLQYPLPFPVRARPGPTIVWILTTTPHSVLVSCSNL